MKTVALLCTLSIALIGSRADADVTLAHFKSSRAAGGADWEVMKLYFEGAGTAYMVANAELFIDHRPQLFCPPKNFSFAAQNYVDIVTKKIAEASPPSRMTL